MLTTNPEYNRPHKYVCAKCGKDLCDSCAEEELKANRVREHFLMY